ncbi:MAG: T9SS type A sorting domain-containing protein [Bacteroidia bacterium]|nr:T9SS type A sorting domain-containing protein [Bacteroidia bacterium]
MIKQIFTALLLMLGLQTFAQCPCDCPYPVLFIHGWTGSYESWDGVTGNPDFASVWGGRVDIFHAAPNATTSSNIAGSDGLMGTADDDIQWVFTNENNVLNAGCIYAMNFDVSVGSNGSLGILPLAGGAPGLTHSDNNESAITKQGALVGKAINAILAANPAKKKVILVGHSMGGLASREYLQRRAGNTATGTPRWWVQPAAADGHKVAKLLTVGTPHRGSNTLGNLSNIKSADPNGNPGDSLVNGVPSSAKVENILPDLSSESVRDLRYSYDNINLFQQDYPGVYLFGGKETDIPTFPYSYWNNDVNCDGATTSAVQVGVNQNGKTAGFAYEWDGTRDNPNMPLPTNVRYTYYVSNTLSGGSLSGGDLVVDDQRQWLFTGGTGTGSGASAGTPAPSDGTPNRLSDRIYLSGGPDHLSETSDVANVVRGLDEGDYPVFAHDINKNVTYAGMAQIRASIVPEGPNTTDADWFKFTITAASPVSITINSTPGLAGRLDFYGTTPASYAALTVNGSQNKTFTAGSTSQTKTISLSNLNPGTYYVRVRHNAVTANNWKNPYRLTVTANSNAKTGTIGQDNPITFLSSAPNPVQGEGKIQVAVAREAQFTVVMRDIAGAQVGAPLFEGEYRDTENILNIPFNVSDVPAGVYFIQVNGDGFTQTMRMMVVK